MKQKISPEEYNRVIECLDIEDVLLIDCSFKLKETNAKGGIISLKMSEKYSFEDKEKATVFYPSFTIEGSIEDDNKNELLFIVKMKYSVIYSKSEYIEVTNAFLDVFKELSLSNIMWPYFRELTQSLITRGSLPSITLPLRKTLNK